VSKLVGPKEIANECVIDIPLSDYSPVIGEALATSAFEFKSIYDPRLS
jgi:hypothetical protein